MNKFRLGFLIFCFALPFISHGQADTIYYDENGHRTEFDNADFYRVIKDTVNKFKVEEYTLSNRLKESGYYISLDTNDIHDYRKGNTIMDGPFIYYGKKGYKQSEGVYEKNKQVGDWSQYYEDTNKLWYTEHYTDGQQDGELVSYYLDGKLKRREQHRWHDTTISGKCFDEEGHEIPFAIFRTMPKAPYSVPYYLSSNLKYPKVAKNKNIEGRVITKFVVDTDGTILDVKTVRGIGGGCDEEAARVITSMPKWIPATSEGKNVKVFFTLPILFKLED